ncbi:gamma-glutamylcyclotransferase [Rhodobacteraceae bacterium RKSG542]|uniref:gamma-glutamylcyclotransferase family protein n=1 Tax=Pseudovibrio flavus TaxID=2529854 RepID=UPI0012BD48FB|nr:gamma-glutamylcyclotransferase family protein [Pseudovibrio flavus]MTI16738.1 gamma-glutamylcyclotransferase [Pseudovibrio flavus]
MQESESFSYFGYGSLVNEDTLPEGTTVVAGELSGYVREWGGCARWNSPTNRIESGVCALSVRKQEGATIKGVLVLDKMVNLPRLDERERHYDRLTLDTKVFAADKAAALPDDMFMYKVSKEYAGWGSDEYPILQSYVDCVLAGFDRLWGQAGIDHFMQTTLGWDRVPILNDRHSPFYPRAVSLDRSLHERIDAALSSVGARLKALA